MKSIHSLPRSIIGQLIVAVWIVFSIFYIGNGIWQNFKQNELAKVYSQAQADTVLQLITEAEKCEPIPVFAGEKQIELIKIGCEQ